MGTLQRTCATAPRRGPLPILLTLRKLVNFNFLSIIMHRHLYIPAVINHDQLRQNTTFIHKM